MVENGAWLECYSVIVLAASGFPDPTAHIIELER